MRNLSFYKKDAISGKKGLRVRGPIRKYPFTGGAEMQRRGARRAEAMSQSNETQKKIRGNRGGARHKVRAHPVKFVSTLFEIASN
jgi:hypothetical protein